MKTLNADVMSSLEAAEGYILGLKETQPYGTGPRPQMSMYRRFNTRV